MKIIRNLVTWAGLTIVALALSTTGARAQSLSTTTFAGTFTLPFNAQWGRATLPAGQYSLYYGTLGVGSPAIVEVVGKDKKSPHVLIPTQAQNDASATKNELVCIRDGNSRVVRALEMPEIGQAVEFAMPNGMKLLAQHRSSTRYTQLADAPMLIQRIPVTLNQK